MVRYTFISVKRVLLLVYHGTLDIIGYSAVWCHLTPLGAHWNWHTHITRLARRFKYTPGFRLFGRLALDQRGTLKSNGSLG
jgi:hypothetical protein